METTTIQPDDVLAGFRGYKKVSIREVIRENAIARVCSKQTCITRQEIDEEIEKETIKYESNKAEYIRNHRIQVLITRVRVLIQNVKAIVRKGNA